MEICRLYDQHLDWPWMNNSRKACWGSQRMPILNSSRHWGREELSVLVVSYVTQKLQIVEVHLLLCCSMWNSLQAPEFYGSCGKTQSQQYESSVDACVLLQQEKILTPFPSPCSFGHKCYKTTRDKAGLPRSEFNLAKFISWKVVEQTRNIIIHQDRFVYKALLNVFLLGFPNIKTHFEPPISISLIFRKVNAVQTGFSSFSRPHIFQWFSSV